MHDDEAPTLGSARRSVEVGWSIGGQTVAPSRMREGQTIGPYKLLDKLGEGGFGIVWLAEQSGTIRRRVALKVIKPGMDTSQVTARFEAERQALAVMDHPSIAKVFDGGLTEDGRPYFVLELVEGKSITDFADSERCGIKERVRLMAKVCDAIQHAHNKGVIHRDLKPNNILVAYIDGRPTPKVIDFGVAKALNQRLTERTIYTEQGQLIGTPAYMSPEQAEGSGLDIDTRADVYSLGVILYELLTGQIPYDPNQLRTASFAEIQRIVCEVEPLKPSQKYTDGSGDWTYLRTAGRGVDPAAMAKTLRRDLDWVVMRCLAKNREMRYPSASALGDDLTRFLDGYAVSARRSSIVYSFAKSAQRNKATLAGALVVAAIGIGAVSAGVLALSGGNLKSQNARLALENRVDAHVLQSRLSDQLATEVDLQSIGLLAEHDARWMAGLAASGAPDASLAAYAALSEATSNAIADRRAAGGASLDAAQRMIRAGHDPSVAMAVFRLGLHDAFASSGRSEVAVASIWQETGRRMDTPKFADQREALIEGFGSAAPDGAAADVGEITRSDARRLVRELAMEDARALEERGETIEAASAWLRVALVRLGAGQADHAITASDKARSLALQSADPVRGPVLGYAAAFLRSMAESDGTDARAPNDAASRRLLETAIERLGA